LTFGCANIAAAVTALQIAVVAFFGPVLHESVAASCILAACHARIRIARIAVVACFDARLYESVAARRRQTRIQAIVGVVHVSVVASFIGSHDTIAATRQ
jgi:hypothetical protein